MDRSPLRLSIPSLVAAAIPLASALAVGAASSNQASWLGDGTWRGAVLAAAPFSLIAVLAARAEWARSGFVPASITGLLLTGAGWSWATVGALQAMQTGSPLSLAIGLVLFRMLPIIVLSVMVTVLVVRGLFTGGPTR